MKKADLKQHLETYCIYRPQTCEFCSREIALTNLQVSNILFCLFIIYNNYDYKLVLAILVDKKKKNRPAHGLPGKSCAKFRTGKFRPEIAFTICTISAIYRKKRPRRPETGFKDGFEEREHEFPIGIFLPEKTGLPFQMFLCSQKFSATTTQKVVFPFFPTGFSFFFCNSGKQSPFSHRT